MSRDRIVISVLVVAGILGAFWFGLLSPKRQDAQRLEAQLATQQQRLAKAQAGAAEATSARDRYNADYKTVALLGKAVPAATACRHCCSRSTRPRATAGSTSAR